eukprot:Phypoly_transcript_01216.p1 GENE.Phypoly_transcript_01216~~Phypoly_transcript_01216.p1  ORF type:complete len:1095 (+),score=164.79 Phypoly_transcript_01216:391-3285(+)
MTHFGPTVSFWSFPTKEIARQLTLIEFKAFARIEYCEFIAQVWARDGADLKAANILAVINHFNKVSAWTCSEIVNTPDLQQRIERVMQLIDIAQQFFVMNNFNGLMAVLAGLHSSPVHRLKRTWAGVPDKSKETFEFLTEFMASAKNYTQYREHLQKAQLPVLPYLGVYLSDLTFIEEGNPGEIGHLVNFSKCRQISAIIRRVAEFQSVSYSFVGIPFVQNYFNFFSVIDDKQAYEHSTKLEPRAQSTQVPYSATSSLGSSSTSLTSSSSLEKDFEPSDIVDMAAENDKSVESVHARFRKDLIRSRNNSLNNSGEPFSVKVQLPGAVPVDMRISPATNSKQAVKGLADFFSGLNEQYCLVVMPVREDAKGYIFTADKIVKEVLSARERDRVTTKLALFASPLVITCALFSGSVLGDCRDVLVDMAAPLYSMFSVFQDILRISDDITYMVYDQKAKKVWWMNMHKSLGDNHFEKSACILIVFPLSNFVHRSVESMAGGDKQGILLSGGREGTLNTLKVATVRQLWAILSGPFLLCYKSKNDAAPADVIVLDGFTIQGGTSKHVSVLLDRSPMFPPCTTGNKNHYSLSAETDAETRVWLRACQRNRGVLGDKVIFGEELDKIAKISIPSVINKTVNFINSHALHVEGLFKSNANSSLVQHYKNQFDQGVDVEFTRANDPCTVAYLLLLYLEELPNPLLTYELFPLFIEFGLKPPPQVDNEVTALREIVSKLSYSHMTVLAYLLAFLAQVSIENPIKGGIVNVFGPLILRVPPLDDRPKGCKEATRTVLRKLIQHREKIFVGISRRPESVSFENTPPPCSNSPNNNNPQCKEFATVIEKQLINNAAVAKRVELLKSQLENKYMENKYKIKRQVSFHEDINKASPKFYSRNSPGYRNHKSVSYVTRPTFDDQEDDEEDEIQINDQTEHSPPHTPCTPPQDSHTPPQAHQQPETQEVQPKIPPEIKPQP